MLFLLNKPSEQFLQSSGKLCTYEDIEVQNNMNLKVEDALPPFEVLLDRVKA